MTSSVARRCHEVAAVAVAADVALHQARPSPNCGSFFAADDEAQHHASMPRRFQKCQPFDCQGTAVAATFEAPTRRVGVQQAFGFGQSHQHFAVGSPSARPATVEQTPFLRCRADAHRHCDAHVSAIAPSTHG
jgi:hypothetical protein